MAMPPELAHIGKSYVEKIGAYLTGDFSKSTLDERKVYCGEARNLAAIAGAAVSPLPIPFADIWTITPIQIAMVQAIGNIYGYRLGGKNLKAVFATVAGGWLGQQTCLALFKIGLPGAGGFGGSAFVYVWTHAMGRAAEAYFASGMTLTRDELKNIRKSKMLENDSKANSSSS